MFDRISENCEEFSNTYENSLHVDADYLDNFSIKSGINRNNYSKYHILKEYGGFKSTTSEKVCASFKFFIYEITYSYYVISIKNLPFADISMMRTFK